ncbi:MAG: hypothetical protein FJX77_00715 [Armatimonadetes bacterium]|nr:hypothetical protein [Armatimonadota bacterium]
MGHPLLLLLAALAPGIPSPLPQPAGERLAALFPPSALQTDIVSVPFLTTEMVQALPLGSTRVAPGSVEVVRDGIPLREGRDFAVDLATGVVHLTQPTPPATALTVRYRLGPRAAAPALQRPNPARSVRTARLHYLFGSAPSPTSRPGAGVRISTLREQSQSGLRLQEFRDEMRQGKGDQGAVSYRRTEALDPRTAQAAREEVTTRVDVQPDPGTRLRVNQSVSREGLFTSGYREQEQSRVQWDRVLGRSTASLLWEQNRALGPQLANARDLFSLGVTHPFSRRTTVAGTFSTEDSLFRGRETGGLVTLRQLVGSAADLQVTAQQRVSQPP